MHRMDMTRRTPHGNRRRRITGRTAGVPGHAAVMH